MQGGYFSLPKALFTDNYPTMGLPAKVLYAMILDRLSLSEKNRWTDENGDIFALFAREEMAASLNISRPTATRALAELKNAGLIREISTGRNRPSRLYAVDGNLFSDRKNLADRKIVSDSKQFPAEGKNFSFEGKKLYTSNLNKQPKSVTNNNPDPKREIFDHWNAQEIIRHRKLDPKTQRTLNSAMNDFSSEEVCQAITNYAAILKGDSYYWTHTWTLREFLQRGLDKFLNWEVAARNYRSNSSRGGVPKDPIRDAIERAAAQDAAEETKGESLYA